MSRYNRYTGLTASEVEENRRLYGENVLTPPKREPLWKRFLEKFRDPLIIILLIAGALSIVISFYEFFGLDEDMTVFFEPVGIFVAIILATGLAFIFEYKADQEFSVLNKVSDDEPVQVIRDGEVTRVPKREVVVGDVVMVETGDEIPADGELVEAVTLNVDESSLTGEPVCHKSVLPEQPSASAVSKTKTNMFSAMDGEHIDDDTDATYPTNWVMRGTKVMEGHGMFVVRHVGDATENGKVFTAAQIDNSVRTPLNEQLDRLGKLISRLSYGIAALVVLGRLVLALTLSLSLTSFIAYLLQTVMIAVTLIVVAVPEGLPMAVTLSLAYSMRRMLRTNNLVRKMHACETMGAVTVICTDKTGTLTQNKMRVSEIKINSNVEDSMRLLYENIAVNSTAELSGDETLGNPTEAALLLWLRDQADKTIRLSPQTTDSRPWREADKTMRLSPQTTDYRAIRDRLTIVDQVPFTTERKYMQTTTEDGTFVKGAPEVVMAMCRMDEEKRHECEAILAQWQSKAMRTLALAWDGRLSSVATDSLDNVYQFSVHDGELQALVAISDPVREDVPAAVGECMDAGIDVKIVTGDTPGTAMEIARQIGLLDEGSRVKNEIMTGTEFAALTDDELRQCVKGIKVIARARPMDKKRLVEALQTVGEVVAVTGDGTNDAPALHAAHVGLSMGDGTAVAKEASDITIVDNSFSSIGRAVMWGRSLYRNIQRFILFQMTVNVVACLTVLVGAFFDTQSPLTVTQMLWVNLIMDTFAAMALASLPPTWQVMRERPRDRQAFIISRPMRQFICGMGILMTIVLLIIYFWFERTDGSLSFVATDVLFYQPPATDGSLSRYELSFFFTVFVMMQFWNLFNAKSFLTSTSTLKGLSKGFVLIASLIFFGQILIVEFGGAMFNVVPLSWQHWLAIIASTSVIFWGGEVWRLLIPNRRR